MADDFSEYSQDKPRILTIDQAQGTENDYVILSCTDTFFKGKDTEKADKMINVALTRARLGLIIVG